MFQHQCFSMTGVVVEPAKARILIVDDEPANLAVLATALEVDYELFAATSGGKALELVKEVAPDLILLDIMMLDLDGVEVCRIIKSDAAIAHIPVIFLTAMTGKTNEAKGLEAGGIDYLTKPLAIELVKLRVKNQIEHARIVQRHASDIQAEIQNDANRYAILPWRFVESASTLYTPNGSALLLTSHESVVLKSLLATPGKNVCYQEIFTALGQPNDRFGKARLEVLITRLRAKVTATDPAATLPIKARRNIGYVFLCMPDQI